MPHSISDRAFHAHTMRQCRGAIRKFANPAGRSTLYEDWLRAQPAEYRATLIAAEQQFAVGHSARLLSLEAVVADSMEGYEDSSAGGTRELFSGHGDWSWQPQRYPQDPGDSTRAELEAQMPTYRPAPHPLHNVRPGA
jgi:hypothetical protein